METIIMSERGQITIPKKMRDRFGMSPKAPVIMEESKDGILIKPAHTISVRIYSDKEVEEYVKSDILDEDEARGWKQKLAL